MANCPNCGNSGFTKECGLCNYTKPETKVLEEAVLMFCNKCSCTYLNGCPSHPITDQKLVKY
jgi:hypothetical protein